MRRINVMKNPQKSGNSLKLKHIIQSRFFFQSNQLEQIIINGNVLEYYTSFFEGLEELDFFDLKWRAQFLRKKRLAPNVRLMSYSFIMFKS